MPNATVRANARSMPKAKRAAVSPPIPDELAFLPDRYAMVVNGTCLEPEVRDGELMLFDRTVSYAPGDLVVVFMRAVAADQLFRAKVKRLVMAPPPWVTRFPYQDHPKSDVLALVGLEMNNPPRRFARRCSDLLGIHKCLGVAPPDAARAQLPVAGQPEEAAR